MAINHPQNQRKHRAKSAGAPTPAVRGYPSEASGGGAGGRHSAEGPTGEARGYWSEASGGGRGGQRLRRSPPQSAGAAPPPRSSKHSARARRASTEQDSPQAAAGRRGRNQLARRASEDEAQMNVARSPKRVARLLTTKARVMTMEMARAGPSEQGTRTGVRSPSGPGFDPIMLATLTEWERLGRAAWRER